MAADVVMPRLTDSMEEGTVLSWLKSVGDPVRKGEPLVEIETDKTALPYEADSDGVLLSIAVGEGETVPIGTTIGRIGDGGEDAGPPATGVQAAAGVSAGALPPTSPLARRLATEQGVDLSRLTGTGRGGMITRRDVERAAEEHRAAPVAADAASGPTELPGDEVEVVALTRLQDTVARRMTESTTTVPHFSIDMRVEIGEALALRERLVAATPPEEHAPSLNDLVLRAAALALRRHPDANASWDDGRILRHPRVHVGFAVAATDALVVPVLRDTDRSTLREIAAATAGLTERARAGTLEPADVAGGTFTVTNLGMYGVERFVPIINPPQAAILAVGGTRKVAEPDDHGAIGVRDVLTLTLVSDHRVLYGTGAAAFLSVLRVLLEDPYQLVS